MSDIASVSLENPLEDIARELGDSFGEFGFAIVRDHGVPDDLIARAEEAKEQIDSGARNELAMLYRALAERESSIIEQTRSITSEPLDRRARFELRRLASEQEEVRLALIDMTTSNEELDVSPAFRHAHDQLDRLCTTTIQDLRDGDVTDLTIHREQMVMTTASTNPL